MDKLWHFEEALRISRIISYLISLHLAKSRPGENQVVFDDVTATM